MNTWWTFEVCPTSHVRKFHIFTDEEKEKMAKLPESEQKRHLKHADYVLGALPADAATLPSFEVVEPNVALNGRLKYIPKKALRFTYGNGTRCEAMPWLRRQVHLDYYCSPFAVQDEILAVSELSTCVYEVVLLTSYTCSFKELEPRPPSIQVTCSPDHLALDDVLAPYPLPQGKKSIKFLYGGTF